MDCSLGFWRWNLAGMRVISLEGGLRLHDD
jgi:hypothetical protein